LRCGQRVDFADFSLSEEVCVDFGAEIRISKMKSTRDNVKPAPSTDA